MEKLGPQKLRQERREEPGWTRIFLICSLASFDSTNHEAIPITQNDAAR
jgi:hypothetical protein